MIPEDVSGDAGADGRIGISAEPPGFLKRLFSVPKNVRRTAAAGDVVVPVIGARDGWGGIRQARLMLRLRLWSASNYRVCMLLPETRTTVTMGCWLSFVWSVANFCCLWYA